MTESEESDEIDPIETKVNIAIVLLVTTGIMAGYTFGWLVGASQSPVVGVSLPVLVAIFTTVWLVNIKGAKFEENIDFTLTCLGFGFLFLVGCNWGIQEGIQVRSGFKVETAMEQIDGYHELKGQQKAAVVNAFFRLRQGGITSGPDQEFALKVLSENVVYCLDEKNDADLFEHLDSIVDFFVYRLGDSSSSNLYAPANAKGE